MSRAKQFIIGVATIIFLAGCSVVNGQPDFISDSQRSTSTIAEQYAAEGRHVLATLQEELGAGVGQREAQALEGPVREIPKEMIGVCRNDKYMIQVSFTTDPISPDDLISLANRVIMELGLEPDDRNPRNAADFDDEVVVSAFGPDERKLVITNTSGRGYFRWESPCSDDVSMRELRGSTVGPG